MNNTVENSSGSEKKVYTPGDVRTLLNLNNDEIIKLCKDGKINPKKDTKSGKTFFFEKDMDILSKMKKLHEKSENIIAKKENAMVSIDNPITPVSISSDINALINAVNEVRTTFVDRISQVIDEKLDGIDEVVVELIRTKAENEKLNQKLDNLIKENYQLKSEIEKFAPLGFGVYIKK